MTIKPSFLALTIAAIAMMALFPIVDAPGVALEWVMLYRLAYIGGMVWAFTLFVGVLPKPPAFHDGVFNVVVSGIFAFGWGIGAPMICLVALWQHFTRRWDPPRQETHIL